MRQFFGKGLRGGQSGELSEKMTLSFLGGVKKRKGTWSQAGGGPQQSDVEGRGGVRREKTLLMSKRHRTAGGGKRLKAGGGGAVGRYGEKKKTDKGGGLIGGFGEVGGQLFVRRGFCASVSIRKKCKN